MRTWCVALVLGMLAAARVGAADARCMYGGQFYGPAAMTCQAGVQAQCVEGRWKLTGAQCAGQAADPSGEESEPGVVAPRVGEPRVVEPGVGSVTPPRVPPAGD